MRKKVDVVGIRNTVFQITALMDRFNESLYIN